MSSTLKLKQYKLMTFDLPTYSQILIPIDQPVFSRSWRKRKKTTSRSLISRKTITTNRLNPVS